MIPSYGRRLKTDAAWSSGSAKDTDEVRDCITV